jgi:NAD-dependent DNA ligase
MVRITKKLIEEINKDPKNFTTYTEINDLVKILQKFNEAYHSTDKPLVTDKVYDILYDILKERDPQNSFFKEIGAKVKIEKEMVKIPFPMGSLSKIKPDDPFLDKWLGKFKGPYVISDKLDGISAQIYNDPKNGFKMYTRGEMTDEGNIGQDISYLLKYINVKTDDIPLGVSIRGELIITKTDFEKAGTSYKNIRNAVGGIITSKKSFDKEFAKNVRFIAYAIIHPEYKQQEQMNLLKKYKLEVVEYKVEKKLTEEELKKYLIKRRAESEYNIDGIVIMDSSDAYKVIPGYPEYGFAFKMVLDDQYTEATVKDVIWEVTMDSYLKPVVEIEPVELVGTTVSRATAHNAKMVFDNKINKGSKIKIIRSGDVIPYIMEVIKPAKSASEPKVPFKWNETEVDYIVDYTKKVPKEIIDQVQIKNILHFFRKIGVKYLSEGIITKLYNEGYESVSDIIGAPEEDLYNVDGLGEKSVDKIYKEIYSKLDEITLPLFMAASHMDRGLGERKIKEIINKYPNIIKEKWDRDEFIEKIKDVDGFSDKLAERFVDNFKEFKKFYKDIDSVYDMSHLLKVVKEEKKGNLYEGKSVCFTGFRDKEMEEFVVKNGGKVSTSVSSKTYLLVHGDDVDKSSNKYQSAVKYEIQIMSKSEFRKVLNLSPPLN